MDTKILFNINLALDELLTNVISYSYDDNNEHTIEVKITLFSKELVVTITDDGKPYHPLNAPEPDLDKTLEERKVGGLGIHFVKQIMDEIEYKTENNKNILTLKKKITENPDGN